jgi:antitoxin MazE
MLISIVPIGNSKGIRLPKTVLDECSIEDKIELEVHNKEITLRPVNRIPRTGWRESFKAMHKKKDDNLVLLDNIDSNDFTWEW